MKASPFRESSIWLMSVPEPAKLYSTLIPVFSVNAAPISFIGFSEACAGVDEYRCIGRTGGGVVAGWPAPAGMCIPPCRGGRRG